MNDISLRRRKAVCAQLGISDSTCRRLQADGLLPPPIFYGNGCKAWPSYEIDRIARALVRGHTQDELRALAAELLAARTSDDNWQPIGAAVARIIENVKPNDDQDSG